MLDSVPAGISSLTQLEVFLILASASHYQDLDLSYNAITKISTGEEKFNSELLLPNLTFLNLEHNKLSNIEELALLSERSR